MLGGHVRAVFTLITFIFVTCVAYTVTSFQEVPLDVLDQKRRPSILALVSGRESLPDRDAMTLHEWRNKMSTAESLQHTRVVK